MAKKTIDQKKKACLLEFKTGRFTQRELAAKHDLSLGTVSRITKGVKQTLEHAVQSVSLATLATKDLTKDEMNTVQSVADTLSANTLMIQSATNTNINGLVETLENSKELEPLDHKHAQDAIDRASLTLKVNPRHAQSIINNTNALQNNDNKEITRVFHVVE